MELDKIIAEAQRILSESDTQDLFIRGTEFLRIYAGEKNTFFQSIKAIKDNYIKQPWEADRDQYHVGEIITAKSAIEGFIDFATAGHVDEISVQRQAQIDVVSDYLGQAQGMLDDSKINVVAPIVLIGASLEEFLRNWIEDANLESNFSKPGIDSYAKILRKEELITKQDKKDIDSWAGLRNYAAHGEFEKLKLENARIMLLGVNLFMRTYSR